jgi:flavin reductase (DIM6/NTAB) family NADH-FMN oxidoreductase RutF
MAFSAAKGVEQARFLTALRHVPTAVCIVTTYIDTRPWGLTVSAFSSVSADPPTVLVCVNRRTVTCASIELSGVFGVSFLSEEQRHVAETGAAPGVPKFLEEHIAEGNAYSWEYGPSAGSVESESARQFYGASGGATSPAVHGAYCHFHCSVERIVDGGDSHAIVLGRVDAVDLGSTEALRPLLYHDRGFHTLGARLAERTEQPLDSKGT